MPQAQGAREGGWREGPEQASNIFPRSLQHGTLGHLQFLWLLLPRHVTGSPLYPSLSFNVLFSLPTPSLRDFIRPYLCPKARSVCPTAFQTSLPQCPSGTSNTTCSTQSSGPSNLCLQPSLFQGMAQHYVQQPKPETWEWF